MGHVNKLYAIKIDMIEKFFLNPQEISNSIIMEIIELVKSGEQSPHHLVEKAIFNSLIIGFIKKEAKVISVAATKNSGFDRQKEIFLKSNSNLNPLDYPLEIGLLVSQKNAPIGIGFGLITDLLQNNNFKNTKLFTVISEKRLADISCKKWGWELVGEEFEIKNSNKKFNLLVLNR